MDTNILEEKFNTLLKRFEVLDTRHKINLGLMAIVVIIVVIAFFFVKSSIGKIAEPDRSAIEALQAERNEMKKEREALHAEIDYFHSEISRRESLDSAFLAINAKQNSALNSINNKISTLNNGYKKPSDYNNVSADDLTNFFSGLSK
jgi:peptidoglycan hydrolase CwlO-like protein